MSGLNKHILLLMKWLNDEDSVSREELLENRKAAADDAYVSAAAGSAYAEIWVNKYFEISGENKQIYIDAIEAEKASSKKEQTKNYVKEYKGHKVPEGASHVSDFPVEESIEFYRCLNGKQQFVVAGEDAWRSAPFKEMNQYAVELPESQKEWDGEGLPPVDTVCEVSNHSNPYEVCEVLFMGKEMCIVNHPHFRALEQHYHLSSVKFRPLKTQEQKDREAFIEWAKVGLHLSIDDMGAAFKVVEQLANNGARLPGGE